MAGMRSDQAWQTWDDIAKCVASSKKDSCLRAIGRFRPADRSDSLEIHTNCEFTEMRGRSAKRKAPLELGGNLRAYVYKINSLTTLITTRCRGICATSAYKKARVASDEAVFCCLFRTLRLLSELRRRGASRGRPVKWFALVPRVMRVCPKTRNAKRFF